MGVQALVIEQNAYQFYCDGSSEIGRRMQIPCGPSVDLNGDYWATPAKDEGIFTHLWYTLYVPGSTAPTFDSFRVFRIQDKWDNNPNVWYVRGTIAQYEQACADCCGGNGTTLPTDVPYIYPCQNICVPGSPDGVYYMYFGLPTLAAGQTYHPYGAFNNVQFTALSSAGYGDTTSLVAAMNGSSGWTNVNSPSATIVWSASADGLSLIAKITGAVINSSLCVAVNNFFTSP